jgi:hypothetical protein
VLENSRSPCCQQVRPRKDLLSHGTSWTPGLGTQQGEVGHGLMTENLRASIKTLARCWVLAPNGPIEARGYLAAFEAKRPSAKQREPVMERIAKKTQ